ncbi:MAG: hypothetical protein AAGC46_19300 [Solirubrobacteraceae bacterium]|nr:hypothetical protein [Patulibacter sp.]
MPVVATPLLLLLVPFALVLVLVITAGRAVFERRAAEADPQIEVGDLTDDTSIDRSGAVRSVQSGDVWLPSDRLAEVWTAENLERLARTYWHSLTTFSFHTLRVMYTPHGRAMALFGLIPMITFDEPDYELDRNHGIVKWQIRNGVLVQPRPDGDNGYLGVKVERLESDRPGFDRLHVELSVVNFYPRVAESISRRLYSATQSRIHVLVAYHFLRSLAHGKLPPSKVGRFAQWPKELGVRIDERREAKEAARR